MRYILLFVSICSGLLIWIGLSSYEKSLKNKYELQAPGEKTIKILVYSNDAEVGTPISEDMIVPQDRLASTLPDKFVQVNDVQGNNFLTSFLGKKLARSVRQYDILRQDDFKLKPSRTLSSQLETDFRAVAIKVSEEKIAGGFVLPGDRVDLIATITRDFNDDGLLSAKAFTFIKNVRVLAIGQDASFETIQESTIGLTRPATTTNTQTKLGSTITLQLLPNQVEVLNAASQLAKLSVALRNTPVQTETVLGDISFLDEKPRLLNDVALQREETQQSYKSKKIGLTVTAGKDVRTYSFDK